MLAALFDLDGVLIDSEGTYTQFWEEIDLIYPTGIPNYAKVIKGTNLQKILANYPSQQVRDDIVRRIDEFEADMEYPLFDGAERLLMELRKHGIPTAIVTSSSTQKMDSLFVKLPSLREMVDEIVTGSEVKHSKPDPEGYLTAANKLGVSPDDCVVFEDSLQGLEAGRRSGAKVVGIATTNPRSALIGRADIIVDSVADLTLEILIKTL
ncbi:MAG: HAD family phosphatase [Muribaculaceae bacterium]|nr:HAD family phosphatase [Muribaculaceae bacterium]